MIDADLAVDLQGDPPKWAIVLLSVQQFKLLQLTSDRAYC